MSARIPAELAAVLPAQTAAAWRSLAGLLPAGIYLVGGTGLAAHIHHRESRDLDFLFHDPIDLNELQRALEQTAPFAPTLVDDGTLNGVYMNAKVQFLHARDQVPVAPLTRIAGIRVAAVEDILAMKLKVIGDRGELRDYFDVMSIEQQLGRTAEEGLALYRARYDVPAEHASIGHILMALGHFDDVDDDDLLPVGRDVIEKYWQRRQPQVLRHLSRVG